MNDYTWTLRARCRNTVDPDDLYPWHPSKAVPEPIRLMCAACPVRVDCFEDEEQGSDVPHGIRAGISATNRAHTHRAASGDRGPCDWCGVPTHQSHAGTRVCHGCAPTKYHLEARAAQIRDRLAVAR